jgi:hypothetical protein
MTFEHKSYVPAVKHLEPEPLAANRALSDALDSLLTGDEDHEGSCILAFAPDAKLRSLLQIRLYELQTALLAAHPAHLACAIAEMLLGFGSARASEEEAEAVVTQYVTVLAHLPLWAVQRACKRFAAGSVTKTECPDWKLAYAPSTAQLCHLVESMVQVHRTEEKRIREVLFNSVPRYVPSKAEREAIIKGFEQLHQDLRPSNRAAIAAAKARLKQPLQSVAGAVSPTLKQAMQKRDELEQ